MAKKDSERSRRAVVEYYADDGFTPPDEWKTYNLIRAEVKRLMLHAFIGCVAAETPRRLGAEASSFELAGDKFLSKGVANTYWVLWKRMTSAKHAPLPLEDIGDDERFLIPPETWMLLHAAAVGYEDARRLGRTTLWNEWWKEVRPRLLARRRALATFAMYRDQMAWGYRVVTSIGQEIEWIDGKFERWESRYGIRTPAEV